MGMKEIKNMGGVQLTNLYTTQTLKFYFSYNKLIPTLWDNILRGSLDFGGGLTNVDY